MAQQMPKHRLLFAYIPCFWASIAFLTETTGQTSMELSGSDGNGHLFPAILADRLTASKIEKPHLFMVLYFSTNYYSHRQIIGLINCVKRFLIFPMN